MSVRKWWRRLLPRRCAQYHYTGHCYVLRVTFKHRFPGGKWKTYCRQRGFEL